jgi:hypothetical protein
MGYFISQQIATFNDERKPHYIFEGFAFCSLIRFALLSTFSRREKGVQLKLL